MATASETMPPPLSSEINPATPSKEERFWAIIAHLSPFTGIGHILGPLIIWLSKREGNPFIEDQAREALNFQISFSIYMAAAIIGVFMLIGIPLLIILPAFHFVCMIIAAIKASDGIAFRYPLTLRLIK